MGYNICKFHRKKHDAPVKYSAIWQLIRIFMHPNTTQFFCCPQNTHILPDPTWSFNPPNVEAIFGMWDIANHFFVVIWVSISVVPKNIKGSG